MTKGLPYLSGSSQNHLLEQSWMIALYILSLFFSGSQQGRCHASYSIDRSVIHVIDTVIYYFYFKLDKASKHATNTINRVAQFNDTKYIS